MVLFSPPKTTNQGQKKSSNLPKAIHTWWQSKRFEHRPIWLLINTLFFKTYWKIMKHFKSPANTVINIHLPTPRHNEKNVFDQIRFIFKKQYQSNTVLQLRLKALLHCSGSQFPASLPRGATVVSSLKCLYTYSNCVSIFEFYIVLFCVPFSFT